MLLLVISLPLPWSAKKAAKAKTGFLQISGKFVTHSHQSPHVPWDPLSQAMASDAFPPTTQDSGPFTWGTLNTKLSAIFHQRLRQQKSGTVKPWRKKREKVLGFGSPPQQNLTPTKGYGDNLTAIQELEPELLATRARKGHFYINV